MQDSSHTGVDCALDNVFGFVFVRGLSQLFCDPITEGQSTALFQNIYSGQRWLQSGQLVMLSM